MFQILDVGQRKFPVHMTESAAHLSSVAAAADSNLPSIFEVLAQESLVSTLKPALHHVLRVTLRTYVWHTMSVYIQGGPIKTTHFLRYHINAAPTDIITRFLLKCSEITAENKRQFFKMSIKYSLQTSQNMVPYKCLCWQTLTILILKYATEFYHDPCMPY